MHILTGILVGIILLQAFILWIYQRQVKDICRQLAFLIKNDSNMLVSREIGFLGIEWLADMLNELLAARRKERREYQKKELSRC